jgi:DNA-binding GntR family transcriptional regulator
MADHYGVAYLTVRRAMRELRERRLIQTVIGRGTFIAQPDDEDAD